MSDLRSLYQEVIIDHYKNPRNFGSLEPADRADGYNPLCGDRVTVFVRQKEGRIEEISFEGHGCAISTASASLMTEAVTGQEVAHAVELLEKFHRLLTDDGATDQDATEVGKLEVLSGVRQFPMRIKCATLAWHALKAALEHSAKPVTTE